MKLTVSLKEEKARGFIITLYLVGVVGTALPLTREIFIFLTPVVLLLSFTLLLFFHDQGFNVKTITVLCLIFLASYVAEAAGVRTGQVFGSYSYGKGLGPKLLETPLVIGLNWVLLVYCTASVFDRLRTNTLLKITGASFLMVLYDLVMEQVAPFMDMWSFDEGAAPLRNYVSWFILALLFHSTLRIAGIRISNRMAPLIFFCQGIFFIILLVIFKLTE